MKEGIYKINKNLYICIVPKIITQYEKNNNDFDIAACCDSG
jgi:hypothetical protein